MANVTIVMNINITNLFALYNQGGINIATINSNLGSIITHTVTGGVLIHDSTHPNDSSKDSIQVFTGDNITWRFQPVNLPPNTPPTIPNTMKCTFVNLDIAAKPVPSLGAATQGNDPSTTVPGQKQLAATVRQSTGTEEYAITFTINNRQLTFDPKIIVHMPSPL